MEVRVAKVEVLSRIMIKGYDWSEMNSEITYGSWIINQIPNPFPTFSWYSCT
jgi:hypothetical protein